jgi:tetratricopeptide (TPR) repeat protein
MDNLDYIESYFMNELVAGQVREFEERIESDPAFAEEVAFYLSARIVSKEISESEKKLRFRKLYQTSTPSTTRVRKLVYYLSAAAAVAGIIFGSYIIMKPVSSRELADRYIKENLQTLGVTMSSHSDSLQTGLRLYNDGKTTEALTVFEKITESDTSSFEAKKYAGLSALRLKEYDKALSYFEKMEIYTGLYSNPSLFYQALTRMDRNQAGDAVKVKELLQKIVAEKQTGSDFAAEWLSKI